MLKSCWRYVRVLLAALPRRRGVEVSPAFLYHDTEEGDVDQGALLTGGVFRFGQQTYALPLRATWQQGEWPEDVRRWLYSFDWLKDLRSFGTNGARLLARSAIVAWAESPPPDPIAREGAVIGRRLSNWLGHYAFCLSTATEGTQKLVMDAAVREGRRLSALLPLPPAGWEGLASLRGLLSVYMAIPHYDGFLKRFERQLPVELERVMTQEGITIERSPESQYRCVQELLAIQTMLSILQHPIPHYVPELLGKACAVLRAFCHADGGLALFNGTQERGAKAITALLEQAERYRVVASSLAGGGFMRLAARRALLLIDGAAPPPWGFDHNAHAGTLSFEFSHHQQRLIVNCGAAEGGPWRRALRGSAAHSALIVDGESSSDFGEDGHITRRPLQVQCKEERQGRVQALHMSHNGYYASHGVMWSRSLFLEPRGDELRGRDVVEGEGEVPFIVRFHIHPDVRVEQEDEEVLLHTSSEIWRFRQTGGVISVQDDFYMGRGHPEPTRQITVQALLRYSLSGRVSAPPKEGEDQNAAPASKRCQKVIEWVLERVPL